MNTNEKIRYLREKNGWTQQELAEKMGLKSRTGVTRLENGAAVSRKDIEKLAKIFGVNPKDLMDDADAVKEWGNDLANMEFLSSHPEMLDLYLTLTRSPRIEVLFSKMAELEPEDVLLVLSIIDKIKKGYTTSDD